jgi:hypothetical protein
MKWDIYGAREEMVTGNSHSTFLTLIWLIVVPVVLTLTPAQRAFAEYHHVDSCFTCHDLFGFGGNNLFFIHEVIWTPNSGPKSVVFTATTGQNSLADGDEVYDGPCEVCHTQNGRHNNDGHDNTEHFDGQWCVECHLHGREFEAPFPQAHKTHLSADKGPHLDCTDCHSDPFQFFPAVFKDGEELATTEVCDTCHSPGGDYDGVDDPAIGAKTNWTDGVYDDNDNLVAGKEKWCVGCHDNAPSQIDNVLAPNIAGDEGATTPYGTGWGFYKTGHGLSYNEVYPASGVKGAGRGCLDCHNAASAHIDGEPRTYSADGSYLTWDPDSAGYQDGYRLIDVAGGYSGKYPMHIPRTGHVFPPGFRESQEFALCYSCHDEDKLYYGGDPVTGAGATTNFRNNVGGAWISMHDLHTDGRNGPFGPTTPQYDSDYDGIADSRMSCPACHNVHGSPSPVMIRHGELISTMGATDKVPSLGFQYTPVGAYPILADSTGGKTRFIGGGPGNPGKNGVCNMCHNDSMTYTRPPVVGTPPDAPLNVAPAEAETSVEVAPLLSASLYYDPDPEDLHQASQWQISASSGNYTTPIYDSGATSDLTSHRVGVPLNQATTYFWRVRYQNNAGAWSDFSQETRFATEVDPSGASVILNPTDVVSNPGAYSVSDQSTWATALDSDDGDVSYVYLCCSSPGQSFTVSLDDPAGLEWANIDSVTLHVRARYLEGPWPNAIPYAAGLNMAYQTGSAMQWTGINNTDASGSYNLISSQTFTTDSDGGPLDLSDINNLQVSIKREIAGSYLLRITEIWAEVVYSY